jgi:hypothetical protein
MFAFENLEEQMQRLEQLLVYADDSHREIETANLLVARNIPVTFAKPISDVISEVQETTDTSEAKAPAEDTKTASSKKPEVRRAEPAEKHTVRRATAVSPGVRRYHSSPAPLPVRKAIPLQRFNPEGQR